MIPDEQFAHIKVLHRCGEERVYAVNLVCEGPILVDEAQAREKLTAWAKEHDCMECLVDSVIHELATS